MSVAKDYIEKIKRLDTIKYKGYITDVVGLLIESVGPRARVGEICLVHLRNESIRAEVVGFRENHILLMPIAETEGIAPGCEVEATGGPLLVGCSQSMLGRVLDGVGEPMDGGPPIDAEAFYPATSTPSHPLRRRRIKEPLATGIRAIDGVLTIGKGQRMGIFSGSGIGKSILLGMIARYTSADVNVIALVGERGREVREFIEKDLGEEGLRRSVVVVATNDKPPLVRLRAAFVATAIAEYFRDKGADVMLMMDSVTRFARAQREVGLAIGEPPTTRGFPPSFFALLPKILERTGTSEKGSITALYTVLVEADDMNEPVADNVRGIIDGHIVLSRSLAARNHYPAIDVLESISRVMIDIVPEKHLVCARKLKEVVATLQDAEDLINIGAYVRGSNPRIDYALEKIEAVNEFLRQGIWEHTKYEDTVERLKEIFEDAQVPLQASKNSAP